ncbi:MAG TPA: 50S ribosomal protein L13 [Phycisphaerales bacterium]|nr:50S ribosomal protein L13 [Phycisphaerales bacterium]
MPRQTFFAKPGDVQINWHSIDASGKVLGRMATQIASILMGKHRPQYTPHINTGEYVIVTNAEKIVLTGRKLQQKKRTTYVYYPGGQKQESYESLLARRPEFLVKEAVRRMLPKTRLGRDMLTRLKVYAGEQHSHNTQKPVALSSN